VVMLRLELGVLSRGHLGPMEVVAEYVRHSQIDQVSGGRRGSLVDCQVDQVREGGREGGWGH
jgi:hypothetical protein